MPPQGGPARSDLCAARALLLVGLLAAATHERPVLGHVRAAPFGRVLPHHGFPHEVRLHGSGRELVGELEGANLRLLALRPRIRLPRHGPAHDHDAARRPGDRATHHQEMLVRIQAHDLDVARRDSIASHPSGRAHALHDPRREGGRADRPWRAVEHRPVRRIAAGEVMALHDALEPAPATRPDDVDAVTRVEDVDEDLIAGLHHLAAGLEAHFAPDPRRRHAGLLEVARGGLVALRRGLVDQAQLHGLVAVGLDGLRLDNHARPGLDDRGRYDGAVALEDLGHPHFASNDSVHHMNLEGWEAGRLEGLEDARPPRLPSFRPSGPTYVPSRTP